MKSFKNIFFVACCAIVLVLFNGGAVSASEVSNTEITTETTEKQDITTEEKKETIKLKISSAKAASVTLKWNKIKGTSKYNIYRSKKKKSGYKKIATVKSGKNTYKDTKITEKSNYYYKIQAVLSSGEKIVSNVKTKVKVKGNYKTGSVYGPSLSGSQSKQYILSLPSFPTLFPKLIFRDKSYILNLWLIIPHVLISDITNFLTKPRSVFIDCNHKKYMLYSTLII